MHFTCVVMISHLTLDSNKIPEYEFNVELLQLWRFVTLAPSINVMTYLLT